MLLHPLLLLLKLSVLLLVVGVDADGEVAVRFKYLGRSRMTTLEWSVSIIWEALQPVGSMVT